MISRKDIIRISEYEWEIPKKLRTGMRVPAHFFASEKMFEDMLRDASLEQLVNVAMFPGIQKYALGMPDMHEGYGFPIGGVAALDAETGVISPGGIGFDINCGVRLLTSQKSIDDISPYKEQLAKMLYCEIPSGVGRCGAVIVKGKNLDELLNKGVKWMVENGFGEDEDLLRIESQGSLADANALFVSQQAKERGADQLGTMGAGNHFVEVEVVDSIYDEQEAHTFGLWKGQIVIMIHTGSRGLGHQVATDYIRQMNSVMSKYGITMPNRELACVPFSSPEGKQYWGAMAAAANFAWANRQLITCEVRKSWEKVFGKSGGYLSVLYDVSHNIAKLEEYTIDGCEKLCIVHRKGATRSFPGQPVFIPGSMGTGSYVLSGCESSLHSSFGSSCHGAGRRMSRTQAKREISNTELKKKLQAQGISIQTGSLANLSEEAPEAYKDVSMVVDVVHATHIAKKVAYLRPLAVIKG